MLTGKSLLHHARNLLRRHSAPAVLCVDDDGDVRAVCSAVLKREGYAVDEASDGREAREKLQKNHYSAVLLDLAMPYLHGSTLLTLLQREQPDMLRRVIVVTGIGDAALVDVQPLVASVLRKPLTVDRLIAAVSDCCATDETLVTKRSAARS